MDILYSRGWWKSRLHLREPVIRRRSRAHIAMDPTQPLVITNFQLGTSIEFGERDIRAKAEIRPRKRHRSRIAKYGDCMLMTRVSTLKCSKDSYAFPLYEIVRSSRISTLFHFRYLSNGKYSLLGHLLRLQLCLPTIYASLGNSWWPLHAPGTWKLRYKYEE